MRRGFINAEILSIKMIAKEVFVYLLIGLFITNFSSAIVSDEEIAAGDCLQESERLMSLLDENGFSILRINHTMSKATQVYDAQKLLTQRGVSGRFELVVEYCNDIAVVYDLAFESRDALVVLMEFYNLSLTEKMNTESIDAIISDIEDEINSERYERTLPLIDKAYSEISEIQKRETTLNSFYISTTRGIRDFISKTWKSMLIGFGVFIVLLFFYGTAIRRYLTKRKIKHLEARRAALKNYLKKTQRLYFESGELSESEYELRSENFAEMVRDIDRQIPLLNEKLVKYGKINNKSENIYSNIKK